MNFELQPTLENKFVRIRPLEETDFETLYQAANDPLIWEQHPNPDRYKREVFEIFFKGAIESGGAFLVYDKVSNEAIGSSRFYNVENQPDCVAIGYTFFARSHWGGTFNQALKTLMINHAFTFVASVVFHIGANNIRSQKAIERSGAKKESEIEMEYYGETTKLNFIYRLDKADWIKNRT